MEINRLITENTRLENNLFEVITQLKVLYQVSNSFIDEGSTDITSIVLLALNLFHSLILTFLFRSNSIIQPNYRKRFLNSIFEKHSFLSS